MSDKQRRAVEDIIAGMIGADEHLRCALLKLVQWARTDYEQGIINEVLDARKEMLKAQTRLLNFHPDAIQSHTRER